MVGSQPVSLLVPATLEQLCLAECNYKPLKQRVQNDAKVTVHLNS
jgi:hypothetical protein